MYIYVYSCANVYIHNAHASSAPPPRSAVVAERGNVETAIHIICHNIITNTLNT